MSGHSKWSTIKRQKGANDAKRGKIFTRHAKNIEIAARGGGDPEMNAALASAIELAKADNLPKDNIERAIKKGSGELAGDAIEEKIFEGYAPGGVALLIRTLSDNNNRTVSSVRHLLTKHGGKLAESGSVAFQFERRGVIVVAGGGEEIELAAIEAGATDLEAGDDETIIKTAPADLMAVRQKLLDAGIQITSAELAHEPTATVELTEKEAVEKVLKLIDALEEDDDVDSVATNADFPEEFLGE